MFVSRSQLETYISTCQYKAFLNYGYEVEGKKIGLSSNFLSIDLACGTAVHVAIAFFYSLLKDNPNTNFSMEIFDMGLKIALKELESEQIRDNKIPADNDYLQAYSIKEHQWLVKALLYAWYRIELPKIQATKKVILVEKEIEYHLTSIKAKPSARVARSMAEVSTASPLEDEEIILASRCDALLMDIETGELEAQSLKTTKQMGIFTDQMVNRDLQTALEITAIEDWILALSDFKLSLTGMLKLLSRADFARVLGYLEKKYPLNPNQKVERVKYTFFVKGNRKEDSSFGENLKSYPVRSNAFVYGWRKLLDKTTQNDSELIYEYAHSFEFYKPENKSGSGRLGKGWQRFVIEEDYPGGITAWIDDITAGKIQPDANNPIEKLIVTEVDSRIEFTISLLKEVAKQSAIEFFERNNSPEPATKFLANTKSCTWPSLCEFATICAYSGASLFSNEIAKDPLGSGLYRIRVPHHEPERKHFEDADTKNSSTN